ncbi:MAG: DUF3943 domain-containing protein, partial [Saprospiraceae bacterium]
MKFSLLTFLILSVSIIHSQIDSSSNLTIKKSHRFLPALDIIGVNVLVNRFDVYVKDEDWAKVSWKSWKENIQSGFEPDNDPFGTNFFAHPYHGSLYFNASRSTGNSFWGSIPYTLGGSLIWEFFGETEKPSSIDINTTTLGGIYLGEMTHRLSKHLMRNHKNRKLKGLRYVAATALNPMGRLNGLMYQDIEDRFTKADQEIFPITSQLSAGINIPLRNVNNDAVNNRLNVNYSLVYGNIFDVSRKYKPFDAFVVRAWADIALGEAEYPILLNISSQANLLRKTIKNDQILSLSGHYDFLNNQIFKIGGMSVTADYSLYKMYKNWSFVGTANVGIMLYGSTNSEVVDFLNQNPNLDYVRNYVFGRGLVNKVFWLADFKQIGRVTAMYNKWINYVKDDAIGRESSTVMQFKYYYPIRKNTNIGIELFNYRRFAKYEDIPEFS